MQTKPHHRHGLSFDNEMLTIKWNDTKSSKHDGGLFSFQHHHYNSIKFCLVRFVFINVSVKVPCFHNKKYINNPAKQLICTVMQRRAFLFFQSRSKSNRRELCRIKHLKKNNAAHYILLSLNRSSTEHWQSMFLLVY